MCYRSLSNNNAAPYPAGRLSAMNGILGDAESVRTLLRNLSKLNTCNAEGIVSPSLGAHSVLPTPPPVLSDPYSIHERRFRAVIKSLFRNDKFALTLLL